ncbi:hypothetical protein G6F65_018280 [Rhizopus arrhizus]|nr:hypothetical protein G6F65_018280 [Rhizopus arrhizus]
MSASFGMYLMPASTCLPRMGFQRWSPAVVGGIHQAEAFGRGVVGFLVLAVDAVVGAVAPDAGQEDPVLVELDLVLRVEAQLLLLLLRRVGEFIFRQVAVDGVIQVQRRAQAAGRLAGFAVMRIIHPEDHGVLGAAPVQFAFDVLVGQERAHARLVDVEEAIRGGLVRIDVRIAAPVTIDVRVQRLVVDPADPSPR